VSADGNTPPTLPEVDRVNRSTWRALGQPVLDHLRWPPAIDGAPVVTKDLGSDGAAVADLLTQLFVGHDRVDARELAEYLRPIRIADLEACGLVESVGTEVVARFGIERWGGVVVLHDWPEWAQHPLYVMGITVAARSLAWFTPRSRVASVLDLGTGSGVQAVCAAHHAERVVAVDINWRSVSMARASVELNGLGNVEVRSGSWFEPVKGEQFDLIVSNPPFVISPENRLVYRDGGGYEGDELLGALLADVSGHLAAGGRAVVLAEWAQRSGQVWDDTPRDWIRSLAADGLVLCYGGSSPEEYATRWNVPAHPHPDDLRTAARTWTVEYERLGLEWMYEGVLSIRRPEDRVDGPWHTWELTADRQLDGPGGTQLADMLDGHVVTEGRSTSEILELVAHPVDGHVFHQDLGFADGHYSPGRIRGDFPVGLGVDVEIGPSEIAFALSLEAGQQLSEVFAREGTGDLTPGEAASLVTRLARSGLLRLEPVRA
jgi:SAM-dependent methyltransferase